jgi:hypothetical protein
MFLLTVNIKSHYYMIRLKLLVLFAIIFSCHLSAQDYYVDASNLHKELKTGQLKMGNPGPEGKEILINNQYMTIGGKPLIPVMGEFHYSRYPREQWKDVILKMKACGINIIATYVFWIHHEEIEGQFDWSGNKDLRSFVKLCQECGLVVYPRIGPWCHGEVRNGGTPDWILSKKFVVDRSNDPVYQSYVDRYFKQIAAQLNGLMYKDGGPVIGIQLENEYWRGKSGEDHILWLKRTAQKYGLDVPMYTVTGWGNAAVPAREVIPLWGAYPSAPWNSDIEKITKNYAFEFAYNQDDENIGNDQKKHSSESDDVTDIYPFFTCELGVGNQISQHRRPVLGKYDGSTIVTIKTGSGSNLIGYYVFAGGSNPVGTLSSMEEDREETGYWNSYPKISYDFQAAIKESGELAPSYYQVKKIHYFLNEFGGILAPMLPVIAKVNDPEKDLQYSVRVKDNSGFLFGTNYYRGMQKPEQKDVRFRIKLKDETLVFPSNPVNIPDSCTFIWPFNFRMGSILLKYATVQPLCRLDQKDHTDWFFIQDRGIKPELCFDALSTGSVESTSGKIGKVKGQYIITGFIPGISNYVTITDKSGNVNHVIILSDEESDRVWLLNENGKKGLFISDANLYMDGERLHIYGTGNDMKIIQLSDYPELNTTGHRIEKSGDYSQYGIHMNPVKFIPELKAAEIMSGSDRLKISVDRVNPANQLFNKIFIKEFSLGNPSAIRSAGLILDTEVPCSVRINNTWLNQKVKAEGINCLDITGYVQKGNNMIMMDYPFVDGNKSFTAKLVVEYMNSDKVTIVSDLSWLTVEQYTIPSPLVELKGLTSPVILPYKHVGQPDGAKAPNEYLLKIPDNYAEGLNQLYLHIDYTGDLGEIRNGYKLISDNFNNFTTWSVGLKQFGDQIEGQQLIIDLYPFTSGFRIYFDRELSEDEMGKTGIRDLKFIPEYSRDILIIK